MKPRNFLGAHYKIMIIELEGQVHMEGNAIIFYTSGSANDWYMGLNMRREPKKDGGHWIAHSAQ